MNQTRTTLALGLSLTLLGGCNDGADPRFPAPAHAPLTGRLTRAASCDDLLARMRADELEKLEIQAYSLANQSWYYDDGPLVGPVVDAGIAPPLAGAPEADGSGGGVRYTETNTQVAGVDEADFVETDGDHVYLLHDDHFFVFDTDPPGSIAPRADLALGGVPVGMFVADGRAVVFSSFYTYYTPTFSGVPECGLPIASTNETKVTVVDVSGETPTIVSERFLDGNYVDARRHGDIVRVFLATTTRFGQAEPAPYPYDYTTGKVNTREVYLDRLAGWRDRERARIAASEFADFVRPDAHLEDGVRVEEPVDCTEFLLADSAETSNGRTRIVGFSMADPTTTSAIAVSGYAGTEFANDDVVVLAEPDYRWGLLDGVATQQTAVHTFAIDGLGVEFTGSGKIDGYLRDSYAIDEVDGVLRLVSTVQRAHAEPDSGVISVGELATTVATYRIGGGHLTPLGSSPDLGLGETVQSVRFLGDTAYVVTFRQVDPLFVVDLSEPTRPTLLGELTIPGFSSYIHPLGPDHLLTIGTGANWGLALQIFDVSDPMHPTQAFVRELPSASSSAQYDPHAFVFDSVTGLLAIPVSDYGTNQFQSRLDLFRVSTATGFAPAGSVSHGAYYEDCLASSYYGCSYTADVRRGLFIGDFVYAISTRAITASPIADVPNPVDSTPLPAPTYWYRGFY